MSAPFYNIPVTPDTHARFYARMDELNLGADEFVRQLLSVWTDGLCRHGVSFAPGEPDDQGRSQWCGECFPEDVPA